MRAPGAEKYDAARGGGGHNAALVELEPRNILVLDFGQLGDVVLSLPALAAIRKRFPQARITVAGGSAAALVVEMSGSADRTLAIDRVSLRDGPKLESLKRLASLVAEVRRARYDLAIDLHSLSESNLLAWLSGARERVFAQRGGRSLGFAGHDAGAVGRPREAPGGSVSRRAGPAGHRRCTADSSAADAQGG